MKSSLGKTARPSIGQWNLRRLTQLRVRSTEGARPRFEADEAGVKNQKVAPRNQMARALLPPFLMARRDFLWVAKVRNPKNDRGAARAWGNATKLFYPFAV